MNQILSIFNSKRIKNIISIVAVSALIILFLLSVQDITRAKTAEARDLQYRTYFANPKQYDVLFLGSSHVMYAINPLEIWNESGITSFNWGSPSCTLPSVYWKLMNLLDYQEPKLVVVDCFRATWEYKTMNEYRMHEAFDAFPLSYTKVKTVKDLMYNEERKSDGEKYSVEECLNILSPLRAYHSRWDSLSQRDFESSYVDTKGCEFETNIAEPAEISSATNKTQITPQMQGVTYLRRIIEECNKRNIPILLTYLPFPTDIGSKEEANMIYDIANEYSVPYLDFTRLDVVDYYTDLF